MSRLFLAKKSSLEWSLPGLRKALSTTIDLLLTYWLTLAIGKIGLATKYSQYSRKIVLEQESLRLT